MDDGLHDRRCSLSDRGDAENVDDQQDEKGAETPFTRSSSTGHGIGRFCLSVSFEATPQSSNSAPMGFPNLPNATVPIAASFFASA